MKKQKISDAVIHRLPRYYRYLDDLYNKGVVRISSSSLGSKMDITASQIRQDLSCFGEFGQQGYGYNVAELRARSVTSWALTTATGLSSSARAIWVTLCSRTSILKRWASRWTPPLTCPRR